MIKLIRIIIPVWVYLAIAVLNSAHMAQDIAKCNWFDKIIDSGDHTAFWGSTSPLFDYKSIWEKCDNIFKVLQAKGLKRDPAVLGANACKMCRDEFIEIRKHVKEGAWFKHSIGYINALLRNAQQLWDEAVKVYFKNGIIEYQARDPAHNNKSVTKTIKAPFGPWIIWTKAEWLRIEQKWAKDRLRKKYVTGVDMDVINPIPKSNQLNLNLPIIPKFDLSKSNINTNTINTNTNSIQPPTTQPQTQRGRTRKRSYSQHIDGNNDRSRSRDYNPSSSSYSQSYSRSSNNSNTNTSMPPQSSSSSYNIAPSAINPPAQVSFQSEQVQIQNHHALIPIYF